MTPFQSNGRGELSNSSEAVAPEQSSGIDFKTAYDVLIRAYVRVQSTSSDNTERVKENSHV